jgi:radical SAM superfamily enzyme YgiQ (UPF0313 family)
MKICLINPPHPFLTQPDSQAPSGLLYLASSLKKCRPEVDVELVNLSSVRTKDLKNWKIPYADIYGLTGTCMDYGLNERIAWMIKREYPGAKVIIGGPHATVCPEYINTLIFDSIVRYEGERAILKVVDDYPSLQPIYMFPYIKNLDKIPYPARYLLKEKGGNIFYKENEDDKNNKSTVIHTSRGCPYNCAFCTSFGMWHQRVRFRSIKNIIGEMKQVSDEYGIRQYKFCDDTFSLNIPRTIKLCKEFQKLEIKWRCSTRPDKITSGLLKAMKKSGCEEISYGIESGDQHVLDVLNKRTNVKNNKRTLIKTHDAGLYTRALMMIGTPGESLKTVGRNIRFLESAPYGLNCLKFFMPIPGSDIWNNPRKYHAEILDRNFGNYNFFLFEKDEDGNNIETEITDIMRIDELSLEDFNENKQRMRDYTVASGRGNLG